MSTTPEVVRPTFLYDPALKKKSTEYDLRVDEEAVVSFLKIAGIPERQIAITRVVFYKELAKDMDADDYAAYSPSERTLKVYTDPFWHEYVKCRILAEAVIKGNKAIESDDFDFLLAGDTERTLDYLSSVPHRRGQTFINRLLLKAMQREVNSAMLHEIQHIKDHDFIAPTISLDVLFKKVHLDSLWYLVDPFERRSRRFEGRMIGKAMDKPMITITPIKA